MTKTTPKAKSPLRARMIEQMRIGNLSPATRKECLRTVSNLARDTRTAPDRLDAEQVRAWVLCLIDRGLAPASTNAALSALRFFYREVIDRPDVVRGLRNRKRQRSLPRHMTEVEVERLLLATPDLRYRTATLLTYAAGLRISETVAVQVADIKADRKLLHVRSGKGDVERMAPLPAPVIGYLRSCWQTLWPRPATWLFYGKSPEVPIKAEALRKAFHEPRRGRGTSVITGETAEEANRLLAGGMSGAAVARELGVPVATLNHNRRRGFIGDGMPGGAKPQPEPEAAETETGAGTDAREAPLGRSGRDLTRPGGADGPGRARRRGPRRGLGGRDGGGAAALRRAALGGRLRRRPGGAAGAAGGGPPAARGRVPVAAEGLLRADGHASPARVPVPGKGPQPRGAPPRGAGGVGRGPRPGPLPGGEDAAAQGPGARGGREAGEGLAGRAGAGLDGGRRGDGRHAVRGRAREGVRGPQGAPPEALRVAPEALPARLHELLGQRARRQAAPVPAQGPRPRHGQGAGERRASGAGTDRPAGTGRAGPHGLRVRRARADAGLRPGGMEPGAVQAPRPPRHRRDHLAQGLQGARTGRRRSSAPSGLRSTAPAEPVPPKCASPRGGSG